MSDLAHPRWQSFDALTGAEKIEAIRLLEARDRAPSRRLIDRIFPDGGPLRRELYPKHTAFMKSGAGCRERLFLAGNRVGKSMLAAYELTLHATGQYPDWWEGKRFLNPVTCWAAGESVRDVRDSAQQLLLGGLGALGTGLIPGDAIVRTTARSGTPDAIDTVHVRHVSGGTSTMVFKTYEAGREAFQAAAVHAIWLDEEPSLGIYVECLMRTVTTEGLLLATFTPLLGMSEVVLHFLPDGREPEAVQGRFVVIATWDDVPHLSETAKAELLASIPPHLRDARTKGVPQLGSGAIYPVPESDIVVQPFEWPRHWKLVYGLDVGWNRTAAVWCAYDSQQDIAYLTSEHYRGQAEPPIHAEAIKARGTWIPGVIDPAARGRSQNDGEALLVVYRELGLHLTVADNAVEAGLYEVWTRLSTGRLKVFSTLVNWLGEYRLYRRNEKGAVVKDRDHLMDATRYLVMSGLAIAAFRPRNTGVARLRSDYSPLQMWDQQCDDRQRNGMRADYRPYSEGAMMAGHPRADEGYA
jgi:phage terminase large subunit-like protein